jgi:ABC-2 type transport system ATP-binding protein
MVHRAVSGRTVLLSSHQISEVERVADQVAILHNGRIGIAESLANLRQNTYEVTLTVSDPLAVLPLVPEPAKIMKEQKNGRQIQWIVHGFSSGLEVALSSWSGIQSVRTRPATLEEIFIACTRGGSSVQNSGEGSSRSDFALEDLHAS